MYQVKHIDDKNEWDLFVKKQSYTLFVQSYLYGEFYSTLGEKYWILGVYNDGILVGGTLAVSTHAKRANFLYLPYGPLINYDAPEQFAALTAALQDLAKKERLHFIRVSPFILDTPEHRAAFRRQGFRPAPMHILAETTWLLNIQPTEEELLARMEKHHRNFIRRCIKAGSRVELRSGGGEAVKDFHPLYQHTVRRHNFHPFSKKYLEQEFSVFANQDMASVLYGYTPTGTLDAAAVVMYYGNMACYRQGASLGVDKHLPISYVVQWEAIREAKRRGIVWYNFWGIAPPDAPLRHPFYGITHFKKGFGGQALNLLPCQDLPVTARYWFNWGIERVRKVKRGFV